MPPKKPIAEAEPASATEGPSRTMRDAAVDALTSASPHRQSGTALTPAQAAGFVIVNDAQVQIVRRVTIPTMAMKVDAEGDEDPSKVPEKLTIYGQIIEPIFEGRALHNARFPTPARLMTVESTEGSQCRIVVNTVLYKELDEAYPDNGYVGRWFRLTKFRRKAGKKYGTFEIIECVGPSPAVPREGQRSTSAA